MAEINLENQTFQSLERAYKYLTIIFLFFNLIYGIFNFEKIFYPSLFFIFWVLGGFFILGYYLGIESLLPLEKRIFLKSIFDIIFYSFLAVAANSLWFCFFYFLPVLIGGTILKKTFKIILNFVSFLSFFLIYYILFTQNNNFSFSLDHFFIFLILLSSSVLSFSLHKEIPEEKNFESSFEGEGFIFKAQERKRINFIEKIGLIMELISWLVFSICFFIYFFTTYSFAEALDFKFLWIFSGFYSLVFHRIIYPFWVKKDKEKVFKVDATLFSIIILILLQRFFSVGYFPFVFLILLFLLGAWIINETFPFIILLEFLVIFSVYNLFIDNSHLQFLIEQSYLSGAVAFLVLVLCFLIYYFSKNYWRVVKEKENIFKWASSLVAEKRKIEAVLESMGDGVFVTDLKKKIVLINNSAQKLGRITKKKVLGRFYGDVFHFQNNEGDLLNYEVDCPVQQAITERRSVVRDDLVLVTESGKKINVSFYASPILDASDNVVGGIVVLRDVTKEKEIERMKFEFVSIASHELKTPIALIAGHLSMALEDKFGKMDAKIKELVQKAYEGAQRLQKLVNDLLSVSRIEEGKMSLNLEKMSLEDIINETIEEFKDRFKEKQLYLKFEKISPRIPSVEVDKIKIKEVISNLLSNAFKFTLKGGVTIKLKSSGKMVEVRVEDTGIGINPEDIPYLFQKFHQLENPYVRKEQGTGLGLYICKSIIEMHGGKIWVESKGQDKGSTFIFTLPAKK